MSNFVFLIGFACSISGIQFIAENEEGHYDRKKGGGEYIGQTILFNSAF